MRARTRCQAEKLVYGTRHQLHACFLRPRMVVSGARTLKLVVGRGDGHIDGHPACSPHLHQHLHLRFSKQSHGYDGEMDSGCCNGNRCPSGLWCEAAVPMRSFNCNVEVQPCWDDTKRTPSFKH